MKKIFIILIAFMQIGVFAQSGVQTINSQLKLGSVVEGTASDSILVRGSDKIVKFVPQSSVVSAPQNLRQTLTAGNTANIPIVIENGSGVSTMDVDGFTSQGLGDGGSCAVKNTGIEINTSGVAPGTVTIKSDLVNANVTHQEPNANGTYALIAQSVTNGVTIFSPSEDVVFDFVQSYVHAKSIPLSGTTAGYPVTGTIQVPTHIPTLLADDGAGNTALIKFEYNSVSSQVQNGVDSSESQLSLDGLLVSATSPTAHGITGTQDFTANLTDFDYTQYKAVIPISGTTAGNPVTGNIEFISGYGEQNLFKENSDEDWRGKMIFSDSFLQFTSENLAGSTATSQTIYKDRIDISSSSATSRGLSAGQDFTANITPYDYPQKIYVDTKASKVGSNDIEITDATKGYILKSPDGTRWRITVNNAGLLIATSL